MGPNCARNFYFSLRFARCEIAPVGEIMQVIPVDAHFTSISDFRPIEAAPAGNAVVTQPDCHGLQH